MATVVSTAVMAAANADVILEGVQNGKQRVGLPKLVLSNILLMMDAIVSQSI